METKTKELVNTVYHRLQTTIKSYLKPNKISVLVIPENHGGYTVTISDITGLTERIDIKENQVIFPETSSFIHKFRQEMGSAIIAAFYSVSKIRLRLILNETTKITENNTFAGINARAAQFPKLRVYKTVCLILSLLLCFSWFSIPTILGMCCIAFLYFILVKNRKEFSNWVSEVKTIWKEIENG